MPEHTVLDDYSFRDHVVKSLATVSEKTNSILLQMDKVEESMNMLFERTMKLQMDFSAHPLSCPVRMEVIRLTEELLTGSHPGSQDMRKRIEVLEKVSARDVQEQVHSLESELRNRITELEREKAATKVANATSARWWSELKPLIWMFFGGLLMLLLNHGDVIVHYFFKIPLKP
jgi:hypothetical protein